jgi:hypothetical protein
LCVRPTHAAYDDGIAASKSSNSVQAANSLQALNAPVRFTSRTPAKSFSSPDEAILKRESSIAFGTPDRWRSKMNTVASTLTHGLVGTKFDTKIARTIAVFGGVALTVFSLVTSYGIDLSPGLF